MAERHNVPQVLMMARDLVHKVQTLIENKWWRDVLNSGHVVLMSAVPVAAAGTEEVIITICCKIVVYQHLSCCSSLHSSDGTIASKCIIFRVFLFIQWMYPCWKLLEDVVYFALNSAIFSGKQPNCSPFHDVLSAIHSSWCTWRYFLRKRSAESVAAMMIHVVMHLNIYIFTKSWHYSMILSLYNLEAC